MRRAERPAPDERRSPAVSAATESTIVAASASSSSSGGSRPGIVRASSVLPEPGGPISSRPWPPASAISSARRASSCPRTSARSGHGSARRVGGLDRRSPHGLVASRRARPASGAWSRLASPASSGRTASTASPSVARRRSSRSPAPARPPRSPPRVRPPAARRAGRAPRASAAAPAPRRTSPPSDSSPSSAHRPAARTWSEPSRIASAIARSSDEPVLRRSAGARLTVIRRGGWTNPLLRSAPRTRSRASWSAASGSPTIEKPGSPGATSTSTRTTRPVEAVERRGVDGGQHRAEPTKRHLPATYAGIHRDVLRRPRPVIWASLQQGQRPAAAVPVRRPVTRARWCARAP